MAVDVQFEHDQQDVLRRLREQYAAGALSLEELTSRVGRADAAQTSVELDELLSDLSSFPAAPPAGSEMVQPHLVHGEHVLWVGRPDPTKRFGRSDLFAVLFSLLWSGFAIFWEVTVIAGGARTWYAVTNRRVLKVEHKPSGDVVDAAFIDGVPAVSRDLRADGSGSIVFGTASRRPSGFEFFGENDARLGFYDIPDAAHVAELVTQLRQAPPDR
jgi:hypothetical protein